MKTAVGVVLAAVLAAGAGVLGAVVTANIAVSSVDKAADSANQADLGEPADYGAILGQEPGRQTIGGVFACNLSGPRRIKAGAARDHFLGVTAVTGRGETIKSGGRVVKNVTGYDLCKLLAGSWGTLAAMTDITVKVLPKAETEATVLVTGLDDARACAAMASAMGSSCDVSGAAHLPDHVASWFDGLPRPEASTALRLEGFAPSVARRRETLFALLKGFGAVTLLDEKQSRALWRSIRHVMPFTTEAARTRPLWRISVPPSRGHEIARAITPAAQMFYDWAGGLVWVAMPFAGEPDAAAIRGAVAAIGGHATLVRAPAAVRASVEVFAPEEPAVRALGKRVKESFDPKGVLNPGRMWAGA